jgi:monofunctional biosynthetic peptidoglycan transglycosylase
MKPRRIARVALNAVAAGFGCLAYNYLTLPDVRPLATSNPSTTAFIELRAQQARASGKRPKHLQTWVGYSRISSSLKRAVLVAEDDAFWQHEGVDYQQLQESIEIDWARGQLVRGASTITQQLAKNLYLSPSRNPLRKLRELIIARRLEAELGKVRILEIYLNVIEWGDRVYGVDAASRTYFSLPASALGPSQSALLAGAIINPRVLNPARPTGRLIRRQQLILRRMGDVEPPSEAIDAAAPSSETPSETSDDASDAPLLPGAPLPPEPLPPDVGDEPPATDGVEAPAPDTTELQDSPLEAR